MEGYKRIFKYLKVYMVRIPIFLIFISFLFFGGIRLLSWDGIKTMLIFWLIVYIVGILIFLLIFSFYSTFLFFHKISFHMEQIIKRLKKLLKLRRKKIWKYPIIIQFAPPKWISPSEISYLYNIKHFKWNISCLFYKWAAEKRISIDFHEWKFLSFDTVEIKIIDDSLKNMPPEEVLNWNLIFEDNRTITLPDVKLLDEISEINTNTAKSCLEKKLIKKYFSINIKPKIIKWIFAIMWIISMLFFLCYEYAYWFLNMFRDRAWQFMGVSFFAFTLIVFFWINVTDFGIVFKKTKISRYKLSEKWKKILAEIYWYKYFLEACDEKKIKTFLKEDPEYLDKIMPYAIAIGVETEVIKSVAPKILDWTNVNRYIWNLSSTANTMLMSSQRTLFFSTEKISTKKLGG